MTMRRRMGQKLRVGVVTTVVWLAGTTPAEAQSSYEYLQAFSSVLNHVRINYVDAVEYPELVRAAIEGTLRSLDPHSYFVSRQDWRRLSALERGELAVTGMQIEDADSLTVVLSVFPQSPAAKAGIESGDRIVAIDDTTVAGLRAVDVRLRLAGPKGSKVRVLLERGPPLEPDTLGVRLKRAFLEERFVFPEGMVDDSTGYVRLVRFGDGAADDVKDAIGDLRKEGAARIVLDLRGNPGGAVNEALEVSALFLPEGSVVFRTDGRKRSVDQDYVTDGNGKFRGMPLVVLIDEASASASEAVAGALQDHDRAIIVGRRSFGKALMQTLFIVDPTGDNVWLTVARIESPSGRVIQRPYKGLGSAQYRSLAGRGQATEADSVQFRTDNGRVVQAGGGIDPDVHVPPPPGLPTWWSVANDSGFVSAVADSVAHTLDDGSVALAGWSNDPGRWADEVLEPFLVRVRTRMAIAADVDPPLRARMSRLLAIRVARVRWGSEAALALALRSDEDIAAGVAALADAEEILGPPSGN